MSIISRSKFLFKGCFLFVLLLIVIRPALSESDSVQGASIVEFKKNKIVYEMLSFDRLFFKYQPPMDIENADGTITKKADKPIEFPTSVKELNNKKVALKGYVMPLEADGERVKTFLLVDQIVSCLFCEGLSMDQWMIVTVNDPKGVRIKDEDYESPITVYGTIDIGEKIEDDVVVSIYRMKADGIETTHKGFLNVF